MKSQQETNLLESNSIHLIEPSGKDKLSTWKTLCHHLHQHSGIFYMLIANIIFACCTFVLKLIPADMFDIMIVRFFVQSIVFGCYAGFYKHYDLFDTNGQPIACALNILMSSGTNLTYLAAFYFLPLSDLNTIKYTYIVWAAFLSVIFLKDHFKFINSIALILTIIGLVLATKAEFFIDQFDLFNGRSNSSLTTTTAIPKSLFKSSTNAAYYYLGLILAIISSWTKAIQMIARKQLVSKKQPYSVMNFQFTIVALFVAFGYSLIRRIWWPEAYPWLWMSTAGVAIGFCQLITNTFYAKALKRENVQLLSILGTMDIVYAVILQYIFFRETKSWIFYVGASFVVLAAIILSVDSYQKKEEEKKKQLLTIEINQTKTST